MNLPGSWNGKHDRLRSKQFTWYAGIGNGLLTRYMSGRLTYTPSSLVKQGQSECFLISKLTLHAQYAMRFRISSVVDIGLTTEAQGISGMK